MTTTDWQPIIDLINAGGAATVPIAVVVFLIRIWWNLFSEMTLR